LLLLAHAGSQTLASHRRTVSAHLLLQAPELPNLAIHTAPPRTARPPGRCYVTSESWPGVCGDWAAADGREGRTAQRRAHPARLLAPGARSLAHRAFKTMDRSRSRRALPTLQAALRGSCFSLLCLLPGVSTRPPPDTPPPHFIWLSAAPGACCPGAKKMLQGRRKTQVLAPLNNPPPSPAS
jgi:hypothetical protein